MSSLQAVCDFSMTRVTELVHSSEGFKTATPLLMPERVNIPRHIHEVYNEEREGVYVDFFVAFSITSTALEVRDPKCINSLPVSVRGREG